MPVPKMSQLRAGLGVNIVLKRDQPTAKLTAGQISDILTRGDHPRGIKVRLSNGHIGRVQSLSALPDQEAVMQTNACSQSSSKNVFEQRSHTNGRPNGKSALQEDYRNSPIPHESASLADYIRIPSSSHSRHSFPRILSVKDTTQATLEKDFPNLDSALIAAILADHKHVEDARGVLSSLS